MKISGKMVENWNNRHLIGEPVILTRDNGKEIITDTRSEAFLTEDNKPVIFLKGIAGYYHLSRVKPLNEGVCHGSQEA